MAAFKSLLDNECGTTNPLIKLSQFYTHDKTLVTRDGLIKPSVNNLTSIDELVNEYHQPLPAPNTFHLQSLLHLSNENSEAYQWTKEFLNSLENNQSPWNEQIYIPPYPSFTLHPDPIFLDQQPSFIDTGVDNDTVKAAQNILSFLRESQYVADTECVTNKQEIYTSVNQTEHSQLSFRQVANRVDNLSEYTFTKTNPFFDYTNPFEEGLKRLEVHDIVNAVLFFEAAVQNKSDHIDAWLYLGITQCENEQDGPAICALKKCVELDSKNLQAYLTLASCYANEMLTKQGFHSLYKWLANNDKYSHILSNHQSSKTKMIDDLTFDELRDLFFQAVSLSSKSNEIDSDLQVCLGILFHLHDDYDKAAECFNTAVLAKPNDALLWNKLGASVANGGHNEKAVDAYYHALTLSPGFIRARYNLGISCFNLNAYKQAIEHFLIALKQQNNGIGRHISMSENIWRTLAIAIDRLKRSDLEQCVVNKDLDKLLREFQIE